MKLVAAVACALALFSTAPFQCASDPDEDRRLEDSPSEALWLLGERFREEGNEAARRTTLEQLVARYPRSREAQRAELVLSGREVPPDPEEAPAEGGEGSGEEP